MSKLFIIHIFLPKCVFGGHLVGNWLVFWTRDKYLQKKRNFCLKTSKGCIFGVLVVNQIVETFDRLI